MLHFIFSLSKVGNLVFTESTILSFYVNGYHTFVLSHIIITQVQVVIKWSLVSLQINWWEQCTGHQLARLIKREGMFIKTSIPVMKDLNSLLLFLYLGQYLAHREYYGSMCYYISIRSQLGTDK